MNTLSQISNLAQGSRFNLLAAFFIAMGLLNPSLWWRSSQVDGLFRLKSKRPMCNDFNGNSLHISYLASIC